MADAKDNKVTDEQYSGMVFEDGGDLVVNLQDVQEMKFENIPKGTYNAEIEEATYGMSASSQKPMITLKWKLTDAPYEGRTLMQYLSFSQGALPGTKTNLARIDAQLATVAFKPQDLCNNGHFLGLTARVRIDLKEYQGEKRSNIVGLLSAQTGAGDGFLSK